MARPLESIDAALCDRAEALAAERLTFSVSGRLVARGACLGALLGSPANYVAGRAGVTSLGQLAADPRKFVASECSCL